MKTTIVFILDETGSMSSAKDRTIAGFNSYIKELKDSGKKYKFYLTCFNSNRIRNVYDGVSIKNVMPLEDYSPSDMTPLLDTIGNAIKRTKTKNPVLFVIMTDGYENASVEYSKETISKMIKEKTEAGWTFVYLGADHDSWLQAESFGIAHGNTATYVKGREQRAFSGMVGQTMSWDGTQTDEFWETK